MPKKLIHVYWGDEPDRSRDPRRQEQLSEINRMIVKLVGMKESYGKRSANLQNMINEEMRLNRLTVMPPVVDMNRKYKRLGKLVHVKSLVDKELARVEVMLANKGKQRKQLLGLDYDK